MLQWARREAAANKALHRTLDSAGERGRSTITVKFVTGDGMIGPDQARAARLAEGVVWGYWVHRTALGTGALVGFAASSYWLMQTPVCAGATPQPVYAG